MTCLRCQHGIAKRFGTYGKRRIQRFRCKTCSATFTLPRPSPLGSHTLDFDKAVQVVTLLMEGMSIRSVSRVTDVHKATIMSLLVTVGRNCQKVLDRYIRNIKPRYVEADELWTFVHTKEAHLNSDDPQEWGDAYTWVAVDAQTKLVILHYVGKRDVESAFEFMRDFSERIAARFQLTTDGFKPYLTAVEQYFGADVDFAQLVKLYGKPDNAGPDWYGPPRVLEAIPTAVSGNPDLRHVSTSYAERSNLSFRTSLRRFTRLSLGFSKKLDNLKATVALYVAFYNLCRVHLTLRVTPGMESGITDHVWGVKELLNAATQV